MPPTKKMMQIEAEENDDESYNTEDERTLFVTNDDDGTRMLESTEFIRNKKQQQQPSVKDSHSLDNISKELQRVSSSSGAVGKSKSKEQEGGAIMIKSII